MEIEVVEYAAKQARDAGYRDESTAAMIEQALQKGGDKVSVFPTPVRYDEGTASTELVYNLSKTTGKYYLNAIDMSVMKNDGTVMKYAFKIDQNNKWTQKMAYNTLMGRAVYRMVKPKEKEEYGAWFQFNREKLEKREYDLLQYHPNYGFKLEEVVKKYDLENTKTEKGFEDLIKDLKRGNQQEVKFILDGKVVPGFIEAAPSWKSVNTYDHEKVMFPEGHVLSGHYKGNHHAKTTEVKEGPSQKEVVAQVDKQAMNSPAQKKTSSRRKNTDEEGNKLPSSRKKGNKV